jgi:hypothetical protein
MARQKSTGRTTQILIVWVLPPQRRRGAGSNHRLLPPDVADGEGPDGPPAPAGESVQSVFPKPEAAGSA